MYFRKREVGAKSAPISIHPGRDATAPREILRILLEAGGDKDKIVMGHLDRTIHKQSELIDFAEEFGCFMEWDLFGIEASHYQMSPVFMPSDGQRLERIKVT